jgi:uncharacterized membrane protein
MAFIKLSLLLQVATIFLAPVHSWVNSSSSSLRPPLSSGYQYLNNNLTNLRPNFVHKSRLQSSLKNDITDADGVAMSGGEDNEENDDISASDEGKLGEIAVTANIDLPFGADIAFDAFSDLPRQPSWSSWLHSVSYLNNDGGNSSNDSDLIQKEEQEKRFNNFIDGTSCIDVQQLRETKWVMGWKRIRFSWKSKVTFMERPRCIKWESTSGLKNKGILTFKERRMDSSQPGVITQMTLTLKFVAPKVVTVLMKRSDKVEAYMKSQILQPTLAKFRDTVMLEDLGMTVDISSQEAFGQGD